MDWEAWSVLTESQGWKVKEIPSELKEDSQMLSSKHATD